MCPRVAPRSPKARLNFERPMSLTRSTVLLCAHAFDGDRVDLSSYDRRILVDATASSDRDVVTYPAI